MNLSYHKDPFPHLIGTLPEDLYREVYDSWEQIEHKDYSVVAGNRSNIPMPNEVDMSNKLAQLSLYCHNYFQADMFECYKKLAEIGEYKISVRLLYSENKPSEDGYKIRGLHLDTGDKHLVGLWYFKHPEDKDSGGDLVLMNPLTKQRKLVEYGSNVFVAFPNLTTAWHAVTARKPSKYPRRYINLLLESPDVRLHNYQRTGTTVDDEFRGKLINYYE
jgi:hypothetical protein